MLKKIYAMLAFALLLGALAGAGLYYAPNLADQAFRKQFAALGFDANALPVPEKRFNALRYHDITLDPEEASTIETLTIEFDLLDAVIHEKIKNIDLNGLSLSGEINQQGEVSFQGFTHPEALFALKNTKIDAISLQNATFSMISAHLGGVRLTGDLQILRKNKNLEWTGSIQTAQDQLKLITKVSGQMNDKGVWQSDFDLENGKIERDFGKLTRANGWAGIEGVYSNITAVNAEIRAGALRLFGLPWQSVSLTTSGPPNDLKLFLEARSVGHTGVELGFDAVYPDWTLRFHAGRLGQLFDYLEAHARLPFPRTELGAFEAMQNMDLALSKTDQTIIFGLRNTEQDLDIKGSLRPETDNAFTVHFEPPPPAPFDQLQGKTVYSPK